MSTILERLKKRANASSLAVAAPDPITLSGLAEIPTTDPSTVGSPFPALLLLNYEPFSGAPTGAWEYRKELIAWMAPDARVDSEYQEASKRLIERAKSLRSPGSYPARYFSWLAVQSYADVYVLIAWYEEFVTKMKEELGESFPTGEDWLRQQDEAVEKKTIEDFALMEQLERRRKRTQAATEAFYEPTDAGKYLSKAGIAFAERIASGSTVKKRAKEQSKAIQSSKTSALSALRAKLSSRVASTLSTEEELPEDF